MIGYPGGWASRSRPSTRGRLIPFAVAAMLVSVGPAHSETIAFSAELVGTGNPAATGTVEVNFDTVTMQLALVVSYDGLTGPPTSAAIHGPIEAVEDTADALFTIGEELASPIAGAAVLTDEVADYLLEGRLYLNLTTAQHPDGELRGRLWPPMTFALAEVPEERQGPVGGGFQEQTERYPASVVFRGLFDTCTATLVGPKVLLTAAHCIDDASGEFVLNRGRTDEVEIAVRCERHPLFVQRFDEAKYWRYSADYGICIAEDIIPVRAVPDEENQPVELYETISLHHFADELMANREEIFLLGFGCAEGLTFTLKGDIYGGNATIDPERPHNDRNSLYVRAFGAHACSGDSGGAVFWVDKDSDQPERRYIIGIASIGLGGAAAQGPTYISVTSEPAFRIWIARLAERHRIDICGINLFDGRCRGMPLPN